MPSRLSFTSVLFLLVGCQGAVDQSAEPELDPVQPAMRVDDTRQMPCPEEWELDVPPTPPDSLPGWVRDSTRLREGTQHIPTMYRPDVLWVTFQYPVSQEEKEEALARVCATVVGGLGFPHVYVVRIPSDTTGARLLEAESILDSLPQVVNARFEFYLGTILYGEGIPGS